jgi:tetratricopeptide (TPR) repeat protein
MLLSMKTRHLWFLLLILMIHTGYAQSRAAADSLLVLIHASAREDTTKVQQLLNYARFHMTANLDTAEIFSFRAVQMAEKIRFPYGMILGYNTMAMAKWRKNDLPGAKRDFFKALALADKYHNVYMQVMVADNLGVYYHTYGQLDSAEIFYLRALDAAKEDKSVKYYSKTLSDLAINFTTKADYIKAIQSWEC